MFDDETLHFNGLLLVFLLSHLFLLSLSSNCKETLATPLSLSLPLIMNNPENPDLTNDDSSWTQLTAPDSHFFHRDTSNILSDFAWSIHGSSTLPHSLRFDTGLTPTSRVPSSLTTTTLPSTPSSSSSAAASLSVAVTEVSTSNNLPATSSSSEDPAENSTASAAKAPEPP